VRGYDKPRKDFDKEFGELLALVSSFTSFIPSIFALASSTNEIPCLFLPALVIGKVQRGTACFR